MNKLFSKIRKKRLKGNISLLIIIVLLASSVIALLSINQIQRLLTYGNMTFNYFRSFYLAKAWTELWLTEVYYSEAGFKHTINSGDAIVTWNLVWNYTWFNPYFSMSITWKFKYITDDIRISNECSGDNKITLGSWEWIVIPLFHDNKTWSISDILTWTTIDDITKVDNGDVQNMKLYEKAWGSNLTFWLFSYEDEDPSSMKDIVVKNWDDDLRAFLIHNVNSIGGKRRYLTIMNNDTSDVQFCVYMDDKFIPYSDFLITVHANYWDMEVWIQSIVKKEVPWWGMNVIRTEW